MEEKAKLLRKTERLWMHYNQELPDNFQYRERSQDHVKYVTVTVIPSLFIYNMQYALE